MSLSRREFVKLSAAGMACRFSRLATWRAPLHEQGSKPSIRRLRDLRLASDRCARGAVLSREGGELGNAGRTRQFEYTWLRTLMRARGFLASDRGGIGLPLAH